MKPDLLLLHGALGGAEHFNQLANELSSDFRIHRFNFDGHAHKKATEFSIPRFVENTFSYLNENKIEKAHIFGYSMGGYVALKAAAVSPDRFGKLLTLGTKFNWSSEATDKEVRLLNPQKMKEKIPQFAEHLKKMHGDSWEDLVIGTAALMKHISERDALTETEFRSIKNLVTIALGDHDHMVSREESEAACKLIPQAEMVILTDCPHSIEKVKTDLLTQFIRTQLS